MRPVNAGLTKQARQSLSCLASTLWKAMRTMRTMHKRHHFILWAQLVDSAQQGTVFAPKRLLTLQHHGTQCGGHRYGTFGITGACRQ